MKSARKWSSGQAGPRRWATSSRSGWKWSNSITSRPFPRRSKRRKRKSLRRRKTFPSRRERLRTKKTRRTAGLETPPAPRRSAWRFPCSRAASARRRSPVSSPRRSRKFGTKKNATGACWSSTPIRRARRPISSCAPRTFPPTSACAPCWIPSPMPAIPSC